MFPAALPTLSALASAHQDPRKAEAIGQLCTHWQFPAGVPREGRALPEPGFIPKEMLCGSSSPKDGELFPDQDLAGANPLLQALVGPRDKLLPLPCL